MLHTALNFLHVLLVLISMSQMRKLNPRKVTFVDSIVPWRLIIERVGAAKPGIEHSKECWISCPQSSVKVQENVCICIWDLFPVGSPRDRPGIQDWKLVLTSKEEKHETSVLGVKAVCGYNRLSRRRRTLKQRLNDHSQRGEDKKRPPKTLVSLRSYAFLFSGGTLSWKPIISRGGGSGAHL